MSKNVKIASINVHLKTFFFRYVAFTAPFHKLAKQHQQVLALLLYYHYTFGKDITNNKILWKAVFDYDTKLLISEELDMRSEGLTNILSQLRKHKVIINNQVSPVYIPNLSRDAKQFVMTFNFNIVDEQSRREKD